MANLGAMRTNCCRSACTRVRARGVLRRNALNGRPSSSAADELALPPAAAAACRLHGIRALNAIKMCNQDFALEP